MSDGSTDAKIFYFYFDNVVMRKKGENRQDHGVAQLLG